MGFARALCYAAPALVLAACDQPTNGSAADFDRRVHYEVKVDQLEREVADLQAELKGLRDEQARQSKTIMVLLNDASETTRTLNNNARIANENAAKDMTLRGACGQEYIKLEGGAYAQRNRPCTIGDLHRDEK